MLAWIGQAEFGMGSFSSLDCRDEIDERLDEIHNEGREESDGRHKRLRSDD
jgi:hypothetical protein